MSPPPPPPALPHESRPLSESNLELRKQLEEARSARKAANAELMQQAQRAFEDTPLLGTPIHAAEEEEEGEEPPGSGVHELPLEERLTVRRAKLRKARADRREGSEQLKRTAQGVACYTDSKMFKLPPEGLAEAD